VFAAVKEYAQLARENGMTPAQMALAWCYSRPFVGSTIIGATTPAQLTENIDAYTTRLPQHVIEAIDAIHARIPNPGQ
jgi:aryl-alcohol dehydrogenase-like predicted oxidoreductase